MPPKRLVKGRPTVYLDQSTLSGVFRASSGEPGYRAYEPLIQWIGTVAQGANLCLNAAHVLETAAWGPPSAQAMAAWLESLPVVWTRWFQHVRQDEEDRLVRRAAGEEIPEPCTPFTASFLDAMSENWSPALVSDALRNPTIPAAVRELGSRAASRETSFVTSWLETLREDRAAAARDGVSGEQLADFLDGRRVEQLRTKARAAYQRVWSRPAATTVIERFVELYEANPSLLPTTRVTRQFLRGFEAATSKKDPKSRRTMEKLRSSFHDMLHMAVGAAYCSVFTCDAFTAQCLGDVREHMRLPQPIYIDGDGPAGFIATLLNAYPTPSAPPSCELEL